MGVIPSNRNRQSTQSKTPNRISFSALSRFAASLVSSYPNYTKSIVSRKPHAPVRNLKLNIKRKFQHQTAPSLKMGNCLGIGDLFKRDEHGKKDALRHNKHYQQVDNEVIDLDDGDGDNVMRGVSDDSGVGELDVRDDRMDVVMLDCEDDVSVGPVYNRLHQSANKRDGKISDLRIDIDELEKRREGLYGEGLRRRPNGKKDLVEECFTPLTDEEESDVAEAFSIRKGRMVVVSHEGSNIDIIGEKIQCLRPGRWLNDEVINVYLALLKEREKREPEKFLKCHFFNTFFYKKLIGRGGYSYQSVQRWTTQKKLGYSLIECDKIFVPIHRTNHWCLAIINKKEHKIQYLDSFKGVDSRVLDVLARYYVDEVKDKSGKEVDVSSWELEHVEDLPEQTNGYDCGMFMIKYADFYSRNLGLCFSEEHMPYFRKRTAKELLSLRAG